MGDTASLQILTAHVGPGFVGLLLILLVQPGVPGTWSRDCESTESNGWLYPRPPFLKGVTLGTTGKQDSKFSLELTATALAPTQDKR
jgi:hypothetical protein